MREGAGHVAEALPASRGARLIQVSTDYVFDGAARRPYRRTIGRDPLGSRDGPSSTASAR